MPRALLSVSDKAGLADFAKGLEKLGWELVSTGGTAEKLRENGSTVRDVSQITKHPEMMEGRVKTLHPAVHAGILARRELASDMDELAEQGYEAVDLVVVNLYPFHEAVAAGKPLAEAMKQVDVGGPTMLRAAAKNHASVLVVVDPADYPRILVALETGTVTPELRRELARKVFAHTAAYDAAIASYFGGQEAGESEQEELLPKTINLTLTRVQPLRYGENPDQEAAFYADGSNVVGGLPGLIQLGGKELSFNNLLDVDAAVNMVSAWHGSRNVACVIIKHTTMSGVALRRSAEQAYQGALDCDPTSAFGGTIAFNKVVDGPTAKMLVETFHEIVVAPGYTEDALGILSSKKNLRIIRLPIALAYEDELDFKRVRGGVLVQRAMSYAFPEEEWKLVTERRPTKQEMENLRFVFRVTAGVKSNAIVLAMDLRTIGIGAGQMSRVDSSKLAIKKAHENNFHLQGSVLGSDAFFPFADGLTVAAAAGVKAVIQPGGSVNDQEVIEKANDFGMAMIFTGRRVFRH